MMGNERNRPWSADDILEVAKWQKYLLTLVLFEIAAPIAFIRKLGFFLDSQTGMDFAGFLGMVFGICILIFTVYFTYSLARSVREVAAPLYAVLALVPLFNVLVLLLLNNIATGILRGNGIRVRLLGAHPDDLPARSDAANALPAVDTYRVIAIAIIFCFIMVLALALMSYMGENPGRSEYRDNRPNDTYTGVPTSPTAPRITGRGNRQAPGPNTLYASPSSIPPQSASAPAESLLIINQTVTIGRKRIIESASPRTKYAVVFEDDGETGYFYGLDKNNRESPILDALHIYDVSQIKERQKPFPLQIVWSRDGMQACLIINRHSYAVFDFSARRGYCRDGFPAPNPEFTRYPHEWSDDALRFFR